VSVTNKPKLDTAGNNVIPLNRKERD